MSKIEVIPHTIIHIDGMSNDAEIIAAATTCGDYAWCLNFYDDEQQWQLIPESLYIELVKFNSAQLAKERASHVVQAIGVIGGGV